MCGRFQLYTDLYSIVERYGIKVSDISFTPKKEIFPSQDAPVIVIEEEKKIRMLKWGFISSFTDKLIINARSETIDVKKIFKDSFISKRCLVPANAFFEWEKVDGRNVKHRIYLKNNGIFSIACIYNTFKDKKGNTFDAFTILTTEANEKIKKIHHRMPAIIEQDNENIWLDNNIKDIGLLKSFLKPIECEVIIE